MAIGPEECGYGQLHHGVDYNANLAQLRSNPGGDRANEMGENRAEAEEKVQ